MKYNSVPTSKFAKDYERLKTRGKDIRKLAKIIDTLLEGKKLPVRHRDHALAGDCTGCRECHVEPDWLLMYEIQDEDIFWLRTGTHSDLFG